MTQDDIKGVVVKTVEFPIEFVDALFQYLDKLDKPFTEKEIYINTLREGFKIAQYKEYLKLEAEKKANEKLTAVEMKEEAAPLRIVREVIKEETAEITPE